MASPDLAQGGTIAIDVVFNARQQGLVVRLEPGRQAWVAQADPTGGRLALNPPSAAVFASFRTTAQTAQTAQPVIIQ